MQTLSDEIVIVRAASAERDFDLLVARERDPAKKRAFLERRAAIDAKLRGERVEPVTSDRARAALGCVPPQLSLSRRAAARRKLRALIRDAPLCVRELADVIGIEYKTLRNHLAGRRMAAARVDWYHRIESIALEENRVHVVVRYTPTRKRWGWKLGIAYDRRAP